MKRSRLFGAVCAAVFMLPMSSTYAAYIEKFDTANVAWGAGTTTDAGVTATGPATWNATGGNSGGNVSGVAGSAPERLYALGTNATGVYGDLTGLTLTTDFKISGSVDGPTSDSMVRFFVGTFKSGGINYYVSDDAFSWDPNADTDWTTHTVDLLTSNFVSWPNQNAGTRTFDQVIAAPETIGLVFAADLLSLSSPTSHGFSSSAGATLYVDNFGASAVPLPAAIWLFGAGFTALIGVAKKRKPA